MKKVKLYNLECRHNITIPTQYGFKHVIIFVDPKTSDSWVWVTTNAGLGFYEGIIYDIEATLEPDGKRLARVKDITSGSSSEQNNDQSTPDAEDVLFGLADYK